MPKNRINPEIESGRELQEWTGTAAGRTTCPRSVALPTPSVTSCRRRRTAQWAQTAKGPPLHLQHPQPFGNRDSTTIAVSVLLHDKPGPSSLLSKRLARSQPDQTELDACLLSYHHTPRFG